MKRHESQNDSKLPNYDLAARDHEELVKENVAAAGGERLKRELEDHPSNGPILSGGDLDADWKGAENAGDETVGGHAPTPDQNVVDEIGRAVGLDTKEGEEVHTVEESLSQRDENRWELDRRSADDEESAEAQTP